MNDSFRLNQLRTFLFGLAAFLFLGTVAELILVEHDESAIMLIPFGLCGIGLLALGLAWKRPAGKAILMVRIVMLGIAGGAAFGIYEHLMGNYNFVHEIRPRADFTSLIEPTLRGGAPLMAPGILAIGAAVSIAATFARVESPYYALAVEQRRNSRPGPAQESASGTVSR